MGVELGARGHDPEIERRQSHLADHTLLEIQETADSETHGDCFRKYLQLTAIPFPNDSETTALNALKGKLHDDFGAIRFLEVLSTWNDQVYRRIVNRRAGLQPKFSGRQTATTPFAKQLPLEI